MKHKAFRLALIWFLLAALVLIYTDRDAYTWRYEEDELPLILETRAQADAAQQAADKALAAEKREADARREAGLWGKAEQYGGAPETRAARTDEPGLNLMWGEYELTVRYASQEAVNMDVVSAGRQAFIENGGVTLNAAPDGAEASARFVLTDSAEGILLACDLPEGARVEQVTVRRVMQRVFSPDLAVYAVLAGGVLTWLAVLAWDERPIGRKRRRDALILVCTALLASMPALLEGLYEGHDLFFHLNRIEGIASALRCGQFPVRIHASTLLGYGYASSEFYPELFLYLPALLRNLGVSMVACVQSFQMLINLATALLCYASVRRIFASREVAVCASVLYTLSIYRLVNLYTRATYGESLAMIFFPMMIEAMVDVLTRDERRWPLLALSMTGVFMSHLLSTLFTAAFCALAALCCLPRLVREPRRILACAKAAGLTVLCSLWFAVPFLQYSAEDISTSVGIASYRFAQTLGSLLLGYSGGTGSTPKVGEALAGTVGTQPGLALLTGCALLVLARYMRPQKEELTAPARGRLPLALLALGVLATLVSTEFFPWERLCAMSAPYGTFFMQMQFPWRLMSIAAPLLSMAAACGYLAQPRWQRAGAVLALALSVVLSGWTLADFAGQEIYLGREDYLDTRICQYEYTYFATEKSAFGAGDVVISDGEAVLLSLQKRGTNLTMEISGLGGGQYIELPLAYYPGYRAEVKGGTCSVRRGDNNVVRLYGAWAEDVSCVRVWYEEPLLWRAAELLSLAGFALLAALCARSRRRA